MWAAPGANRYPGCACGIPSHLYSFSFDLKPDWSRMYAPQPEIWDYLRRCATRHGVLARVRFRTELREAAWDVAAGLWNVTTEDRERIQARVLISGMGALHVPRYPDLPGLDRFHGPAFHSAAWDAGAPLEGRNISDFGHRKLTKRTATNARWPSPPVHFFAGNAASELETSSLSRPRSG